MLEGKHIILGISGSIAAYKAAFLTRSLITQGAEVRVVMTEAATSFISPLTMSTLSQHRVYQHVIDGDQWANHVELGLWGDAMLIAPTTATTLAKMRNGIADNMVVATYLSAKCPVFFAPAMDLDMWRHPSTTQNIEALQTFGNHLIPVGIGFLASGLEGEGRMAEPEDIITYLSRFFSTNSQLKGKRILITAGPTYETIDPVRFIGNHSSGKMGVHLAKEAIRRGAIVDLILGPTSLTVSEQTNCSIHKVTSAQDMYKAANSLFSGCDIAIMAAAVADYRPKQSFVQKIKKDDSELLLALERTEDIAASLGKRKESHQFLVGFALETTNEVENATRKLKQKNFDLIVLNSLQDAGAGFGHDTNKVTIIDHSLTESSFPLKKKSEVAIDIWDTIVTRLQD